MEQLWAQAASPRGTCPAAGGDALSQVTSEHSLLLQAEGLGGSVKNPARLPGRHIPSPYLTAPPFLGT